MTRLLSAHLKTSGLIPVHSDDVVLCVQTDEELLHFQRRKATEEEKADRTGCCFQMSAGDAVRTRCQMKKDQQKKAEMSENSVFE